MSNFRTIVVVWKSFHIKIFPDLRYMYLRTVIFGNVSVKKICTNFSLKNFCSLRWFSLHSILCRKYFVYFNFRGLRCLQKFLNHENFPNYGSPCKYHIFLNRSLDLKFLQDPLDRDISLRPVLNRNQRLSAFYSRIVQYYMYMDVMWCMMCHTGQGSHMTVGKEVTWHKGRKSHDTGQGAHVTFPPPCLN